MVLLTPERIAKVLDIEFKGNIRGSDFVDEGRAVAKDQLREVVEWGEEICPCEVNTLPRFHKRECPKCWQALRREVGIGP